jgi:alpha-glucosidase
MDALPFIFEDKYLRNEKLTGRTHNPNDFDYTYHDYTMHLIENYDMVREWRDVIDYYNKSNVIMIEAYANISSTMMYYAYGAHFPFNFGFITSVNIASNARNIKHVIDDWMKNLPVGATSSWVVSFY